MERHGLPVKDQTVYFDGKKVLVIVLKKEIWLSMDIPTCLFRYVLKYTQIYDYGCPQEKDIVQNPFRIVDMSMEAANMLSLHATFKSEFLHDFTICSTYTPVTNN